MSTCRGCSPTLSPSATSAIWPPSIAAPAGGGNLTRRGGQPWVEFVPGLLLVEFEALIHWAFVEPSRAENLREKIVEHRDQVMLLSFAGLLREIPMRPVNYLMAPFARSDDA